MPSCQRLDASHDVRPDDADIIDFTTARERQLLRRYRTRAQDVLAQNRDAIQQLYETGMIFTRHGSRVGRDLLQVHRNLLHVVDLLKRAPKLEETGHLVEGEALFDEIEALLKRTTEITRRNEGLFRSQGSH